MAGTLQLRHDSRVGVPFDSKKEVSKVPQQQLIILLEKVSHDCFNYSYCDLGLASDVPIHELPGPPASTV